jgi:hypothetical protein
MILQRVEPASTSSCLGLKLDELRRAMRVPGSGLRDELGLREPESSAVSSGDIARVHFALALRTRECRIERDLMRAVLGGDAGFGGKLSRDDLELLMS